MSALARIAAIALAFVALHSPAQTAATAKATFAGGCFWCVEADFDKVPGVISTTSGYIGGAIKDPTYQQVSAGGTGHAEAVEIVYDPAKVTYAKLLDMFWHSVDPLVKDKQFCDTGRSPTEAPWTTSRSRGRPRRWHDAEPTCPSTES